MTEQLPQRPSRPMRSRLLSVTGVAVLVTVVGSVLIWHTQLGDFFAPTADKEPVVSGLNAPGVSGPPPTTLATRTPQSTPTKPKPTPTKSSKPKPTKPKPTKPAPKKTAEYGELSIDGLSPKLRARLKKAIVAARADGVRIQINSGRRSAAKQQRLFDEAVKKYGSAKAASRWVLPPKDSAHVQGKAVDIKPVAAQQWLDKNGWRYGVCRRYDNEPWHFEALTAPGTRCPPREPHSVPHSGAKK
ncbi:M15 family metallopeptidase [Kribbella albertanoniae]|uniref:Peptidase M15 n=1 Tax=Kribbella albertanoniae TaxID=1266829 RepID=A0A4R4PW70_9ACTN|nr:M15 family metallopeptidase [Kribbella albertanoniae]TDC26707.1 peptidase M15 [Kribbella albertanoniae]